MLSRALLRPGARSMSLLRQPLSRAYAVTTGNAESKTGGDWYKFYMMTADHGDEWWFLLFLCGGACLFCFWHCAYDNCFSKPDINNIIVISPDDACRNHATKINWNKKNAQRRLSPPRKTVNHII